MEHPDPIYRDHFMQKSSFNKPRTFAIWRRESKKARSRALFQHQVFRFPDCLVVMHISLLMKVWRGMASIASSLLCLRGRNQRDGGLGGEQEESECLLQIQVDSGVSVAEIADGDVLPDV